MDFGTGFALGWDFDSWTETALQISPGVPELAGPYTL